MATKAAQAVCETWMQRATSLSLSRSLSWWLPMLACALVARPAHAAPFVVAPAGAASGPAANTAPPSPTPAWTPSPAAEAPAYPPPGAPATGAYPPAGSSETAPSTGAPPPPQYYSYPSYPPPPNYYPAGASSAPSLRRRGENIHDGLYLHLALGFSQAYNSIRGAPQRLEANGTGLGFTAALGFAVTRNVILCARLQAYDGTTHFVDKNQVDYYDLDIFNGLAGLGAVYYFEDLNAFAGGTVGVTDFTVGDGFYKVVETKRGYGAVVELGKEWWVSRRWGLGLSGQVTYGSSADRDTTRGTWTTLGLALLVSATYN